MKSSWPIICNILYPVNDLYIWTWAKSMSTIYFQCPNGSGLIDINRAPVLSHMPLEMSVLTRKLLLIYFAFLLHSLPLFFFSFLCPAQRANCECLKNPQSNCRVGTFLACKSVSKVGTSNEMALGMSNG